MLCICKRPENLCELLISGQYIRCQHCTKLRERSIDYNIKMTVKEEKRAQKPQMSANSQLMCPYRHLIAKLAKVADLALKTEASARRRIAALTSRIQALHVQQVHIQCLDESYHSPPSSITSESVALQQSLRKLDDSFKKLFWQPQMKALACRDLQQKRWHPLITKWCLHLHMPSSAAYTATWGHRACLFCHQSTP